MKPGTRRAAQAVALGAIAACSSTSSAPPGKSLPPSANCYDRTDAAFPDADPHPYPKDRASKDPLVQECCIGSLSNFFSRRTPDPVTSHRWACCASVEKSTRELAMACTP